MKKSYLIGLIGITAALLSTGCGRYRGRADRINVPTQERVERGTQEAVRIIQKKVDDPRRAERLAQLFERLDKQFQEVLRERHTFHQRLAELNADYDASPEAFHALLDDMHTIFEESGTEIVKTRFAIKEVLTAEEWHELEQHLKHRQYR